MFSTKNEINRHYSVSVVLLLFRHYYWERIAYLWEYEIILYFSVISKFKPERERVHTAE